MRKKYMTSKKVVKVCGAALTMTLLASNMQYYPVEIQLRTLAMDLWASMEHRICYKGQTPDETTDAFKRYSDELFEMERRMKHHLDEIRKDNPQEPMQ